MIAPIDVQAAQFPPPRIPGAEYYRYEINGDGTPRLVARSGRPVTDINRQGSNYDEVVKASRDGFAGIAAYLRDGDIRGWPYPDAESSDARAAKATPAKSKPAAQALAAAPSEGWREHRVVVCDGSHDTHINDGDDYDTLTLGEVFDAAPARQNKADAPAMIPSSYNRFDARKHEAQRQHGSYVALAGDIDSGNVPMEQVQAVVSEFVGDHVATLIYSSSSATEQNRKWRVIIPLEQPLPFEQWRDFQEAFFGFMEANGVVMDWALERAGQLVYLPNVPVDKRDWKGVPQFYRYHVNPGRGLTASDGMAERGLADLRVARERDEAERRKARDAAKKAMSARAAQGKGDAVIDAFNREHTVEQMLTDSGYVQGPRDSWRSPYQSSKTYATKNYGDYWVSLSGSDAGAGLGRECSSGRFGDAFDLYCHFEHGGDFKKAVREAARSMGMERPQPTPVDTSGITRQAAVAARAGGPSDAGTGNPMSNWQPETAPAQPEQQKATEAAPKVWPEPVDPFVEHAAPQFPVDHLPKAMADYCHELSAQSGFDAGGYGFALLVAASNLIDHRARLSIGPLNVPAFLWGGLVASAGAGKSPIMGAAMKFAHRVNDDLVHASLQEREAFLKSAAGMKPKDLEALDQPPWKQLIASDTTIEALGVLLKDNPTGLLLAYDELSEFVGRMDAYNGGTGKDRGTYLQAFDGGSKTINRKSSLVPLVVENFSVGVLAGVQPEKLAEMFKKSGGADGLFQRFIVYALPRPGDVDYAASLGTFTEANCGQIFQRLHEWSRSGLISSLSVAPAVLPLMENYHQNIRIIAQRTASSRLAEHYDKFPGFLARILFALHCMECAAHGRFSAVVSVETFNRAHAIAHVLYRHSEAVYEALGQQGAGSSKLMKSACEAILSKGWTQFKWGDLTRNATGWQEADDRQAQGAIDLLIEFDWLREVMPEKVPGRPGRRSAGIFEVNGLVHERFMEQSQRIVKERAARHAAIQEVAAIRRAERPWA